LAALSGDRGADARSWRGGEIWGKSEVRALTRDRIAIPACGAGVTGRAADAGVTAVAAGAATRTGAGTEKDMVARRMATSSRMRRFI
jgi:hypothetical protein